MCIRERWHVMQKPKLCSYKWACSKLIMHMHGKFWVCRALGNAELCILVRAFFPWDAWSSLGGSSVYACFFRWHALKIQWLIDKYTPDDQKPFDIIDRDTLLEPRETWLLSCLCWPIVWLGLQCSNSDRWLTGVPMRDSVIITRWLSN